MAAVTTKCTQCAVALRLKDERLIGREIRCPRCKAKFIAVLGRRQIGSAQATSDELRSPVESEVSALPVIRTEPSGLASGVSDRRQRRHGMPPGLILLALFLIAGGAAAWWSVSISQRDTGDTTSPHKVNPLIPKQTFGHLPNVIGPGALTGPATGTAVSMDYIPVVPQLVLHLRPGAIWADEVNQREPAETLGELGIWLREYIEQTTRFEPSEIEELTIAVNFGARTSVPDIAVVVRLKNEIRESQLLRKRIRGRQIQDLEDAVYESGDLAFMVIDRRTLVVSSRDLAEQLVDAKKYAAVPPPEMEALLRLSDRSRHVTLIADLQVLDLHKDLLLMEQLHQLAEETLLWLGMDCQALSWHVHLEPHLRMETRLVPAAETTTRQLQVRIQQQLSELPEHLLAVVHTMKPRTVGQRRIVGRFPAMMQAFVLGTEVSRTRTETLLTTVLPQKATASLALGAILTWSLFENQTDSQAVATEGVLQNRASTVAECLQRPVFIDFRREPLHEIMSYIGSAIQVSVAIDGDALKGAGLTRNMQQTHDLGDVSALKAIHAILNQYDGKMVILVDETRRTILLTTQEAAHARRQTPFQTHVAE